jgi:hypothetical protein
VAEPEDRDFSASEIGAAEREGTASVVYRLVTSDGLGVELSSNAVAKAAGPSPAVTAFRGEIERTEQTIRDVPASAGESLDEKVPDFLSFFEEAVPLFSALFGEASVSQAGNRAVEGLTLRLVTAESRLALLSTEMALEIRHLKLPSSED